MSIGVGDLYTDPQIHTADQVEYGEGNLGTRGMALFFSSHLCNPLCSALKLTQFDLSQEEIDRLKTQNWSSSSATSTTKFRHTAAVSVASNSLKQPPSCVQQVESTVEAFQRIQLDLQLSPLKSPSVEDVLSFNDLESPLLERAASFEEPLSQEKEAVHYQVFSASVVREKKTNSPQQFKQNGVLLILGQVYSMLTHVLHNSLCNSYRFTLIWRTIILLVDSPLSLIWREPCFT